MAGLPDLQAIEDALAPIIDPDRQESIIELDMVRDIAIKSNGVISFTLLLNDPNIECKKKAAECLAIFSQRMKEQFSTS